jgi:hypothetical protein
LNAAVNILEKRPPSSGKNFWPTSLAGKNTKKEKENGEISKKKEERLNGKNKYKRTKIKT